MLISSIILVLLIVLRIQVIMVNQLSLHRTLRLCHLHVLVRKVSWIHAVQLPSVAQTDYSVALSGLSIGYSNPPLPTV